MNATRVVTPDEIDRTLPRVDLLPEIERGFAAYSAGRVRVPPVGELLFPDANGELHIKYGATDGDGVFVVKIATGFYDNPALGLPSFGGLVIVGDARTGAVRTILLDGGKLTNLRTAAAGAVAAKYLAPKLVERIGIFGSGVQARLQAEALKAVTPCRDVVLWSRNAAKARVCADDLAAAGFAVEVCAVPAEVAARANLLVTTTAAHEPYLRAADIRPGTHVTAMGSDTPDKWELDPAMLGRARVVADSIPQCLVRGEIHHAVAAGAIGEADLVELGAVISDPRLGRTAEDQITVADLTGVAVQDIAIARAVCTALGDDRA